MRVNRRNVGGAVNVAWELDGMRFGFSATALERVDLFADINNRAKDER